MGIKVDTIDHYLSIRITQFFMKSIGMWNTKNHCHKIISDIVLLYTIVNVAAAAIIENVDAYYSLNDLHVCQYTH